MPRPSPCRTPLTSDRRATTLHRKRSDRSSQGLEFASRPRQRHTRILTKSSGRIQRIGAWSPPSHRWRAAPIRHNIRGGLVRILVVEDEAKVAQALREGLDAEHYGVDVSATGEDAFFRLHAETFDLVILDLMLPGRDGLEILKTLRRRDRYTPVLVLTARDAVEDRVQGLDSGADDYLVKPFAFPELLARVRALLRRDSGGGSAVWTVGELRLDPARHEAFRGERRLRLTPKEFGVLTYLMSRPGQVVSSEEL